MNLDAQEMSHFVKQLTDAQPSIRAFIVSLMPGSPDVNDVLQDTNVVIWEKLSSYQPGSNFKAWSFTIAKNKVKAQLNKNKRNLSPVLDEEILNIICDTWHQGTEEQVSSKQIALDRCLSRLDNSSKVLIEARYTNTSSLEDHARRLGTTGQSIRVQLYRIREKLRTCVNSRLSKEIGELS